MKTFRDNSPALIKLKAQKKQALKELLNQCTKEQQDFFNRMYKSFEEIPEEKTDWAIRQCENTIAKNANPKTGEGSY